MTVKETHEVHIVRLEEHDRMQSQEIAEIKTLVKQARDASYKVEMTVNNAKSGWKVLVWVGAMATTVATVAASVWKYFNG